MEVDNLIQSFSEFKDVKNIDRETMMNILEDVFTSVLEKKYEGEGNFNVIINRFTYGYTLFNLYPTYFIKIHYNVISRANSHFNNATI